MSSGTEQILLTKRVYSEGGTRAVVNVESDKLRSLITQHRAFYELSPYYVMLEQRPEGSEPIIRKIQAGFDLDVFGVNTGGKLTVPGPDADYALAFRELRRVADEIGSRATQGCFLEVISFPSTAVLDMRNHAVEGMLRIRIHHHRGLDQPFGSTEQQALEELERELETLGLRRM